MLIQPAFRINSRLLAG